MSEQATQGEKGASKELAKVFRDRSISTSSMYDDGGVLDIPQIGAYRTLSPIPNHVFEPERQLALAGDTPTGTIDLYLSHVFGTS